MQEIWKTAVYDGEIYENYEVSNMGRVRSLNYRRTGKIQVLNLRVNNSGYLMVGLRKDGKTKMCLVHRLIAYAFIENNDIENKEVNHIDENKTNNRVENLEWCNREQNMNHGTRNERMAKTLKNVRGKKIRCVETGEVFESIIEAERKLGLNSGNICTCCSKNYKTCGGYHWMYYEDYLKLNEQNSDSKTEVA